MDDVEVVGMETDPSAAIKAINTGTVKADVLILDIEMPGVSGMDVAAALTNKIKIIFLSAFTEYGFEAFSKNAVDFVAKPIDPEKLKTAIEKARYLIELEESRKKQHLYVPGKQSGSKHRIAFDEIIRIEAYANYHWIFQKEKKPHLEHGSLSKLLRNLPADIFIRVSRSAIVNLNHIEGIASRKIRMSDGREIPVGPTFIKVVSKYLSDR